MIHSAVQRDFSSVLARFFHNIGRDPKIQQGKATERSLDEYFFPSVTPLRKLSPVFQLSEARKHFQRGCAIKPETSMADESDVMMKTKCRRELIST